MRYIYTWIVLVSETIHNYELSLKLAANEYLARVLFGTDEEQQVPRIAGSTTRIERRCVTRTF